MSIRSTMLPLAGIAVFFAIAAAQSTTSDLPSAPSAAKEAQKPKAPAPAPQVPAEAQTPPKLTPPATPTAPEPDDSTTVIRTTVNEVNVIFTVTDKKGRYITDLKRDDFHVVDDGRPAIEIRSFHRETNLPLQVGLLVDASNSVRDRFRFEQESAIEFLNQTIRPRYDKAFTVGFDATPEVTQDFTDNTEQLSKGVRALRPGGGTAMYDALYFACRDKLGKQPQNGPVRRAIVLLSDGDDNQSHVSREEAIEMAQRAEVIVYTISTNIAGSRNAGDKILSRIADATGGRAFFPFQITDVANAFSEIQDELRSQYALSYKPAEFRADGRFHTIEILAQNKKGMRVRTKHGYFAPMQ
ncbi:MAG TPA: VWA domain-containing protein [Terriglobales bacterium]|nr:VWA domain-containing protein [Terriglobales bacterium]